MALTRGAALDLPPRIARALGPSAFDLVGADPWRVLDAPSVLPSQADAFARRTLGAAASPADPRRLAALTVHLLRRAARDGHTWARRELLLASLPGLGVADACEAITAAVDAGRAAAFDGLVALAEHAAAEEAIAAGVARLRATASSERRRPPALPAGVSVLIAADAFALLDDLRGHSVRVVSPSSAWRLAGPLDAEVVVVHSASALDVEAAATLVAACRDGTDLVLVGDPALLPSLGPGQVLVDLVDSGVVPVTARATAPDGSPLGAVCAGVREGSLPRVEAADRSVVVVPAADAREAAHRVGQLVSDSIPRVLGIAPDEITVIAAMSGGPAGTVALNERLRRGGEFAPGDRVVAIATHRELGLGNGEHGVVRAVGDGEWTVRFGDHDVAVPQELLSDLLPASALTVHRSVEATGEAAVVVLPPEARAVLSRPLVYTAFTRARRHLSVVHAAGPELARAVREGRGRARRTRLVDVLRAAVPPVPGSSPAAPPP